MPRRDTDLPFGDAFSPKQLETSDDDPPVLAFLLELAKEYEGQEEDFDDQIRSKFFPEHDDNTRAKNVRLGMKARGYGITDEEFYFTDLGEELYEIRNDHEELHNRFAKHVLLNLHGLKGIEIIEDLENSGRKTTNENLKDEFRKQYGFHIDETSNHWSQMRAWLSEAGIVNTGTAHYEIKRSKIEELIGVDSEDILELDDLEEHQQAFLRALAVINPDGEIKNKEAKQLAEAAYGVDIDQSGIGRKTLDPLQDTGYIKWTHVDGKANLVETTDKFDAEVLEPILEDLSERTGVSRSVLRLSFEDVIEDLDADSSHTKGVALETLAIKIGRSLGLDFVGWRERGRKTGGAEVDVVMDQIGTTFNRWQIQCKNTQSAIESKYVAREVGISRMLQTNTILMIARGGITTSAKRFANRVMIHENISILFLTGETLNELDERPTLLLHALRGESRRVQNIKQLDERDMIEEDEEQKKALQAEKVLEEYQEDSESEERGGSTLSDFSSDDG